MRPTGAIPYSVGGVPTLGPSCARVSAAAEASGSHVLVELQHSNIASGTSHWTRKPAQHGRAVAFTCQRDAHEGSERSQADPRDPE
jgi:hypothetical protein